MRIAKTHYQLARHDRNTTCLCSNHQTCGVLRCALDQTCGWRVWCGGLGAGARMSSACPDPVHFYCTVKCTHKAQKVHGKSSHGRDIW